MNKWNTGVGWTIHKRHWVDDLDLGNPRATNPGTWSWSWISISIGSVDINMYPLVRLSTNRMVAVANSKLHVAVLIGLVVVGGWEGVASYVVSRRHAVRAAATSLLLPVPATQHRPLEVCLVSVQRVVYWAALQADEIVQQQQQQSDREAAAKLYLEARLGAKAVLTGRLPSSGSTRRVYTLTSLHLTGCLQDLTWYAHQQQKTSSLDSAIRSWTEALAGMVEFDGLDTLTDPSPRTSLTLSQYTDPKAAYIVRVLRESVVMAGQQQILPAFGATPLRRAQEYIAQLYASEVYPPPSSVAASSALY